MKEFSMKIMLRNRLPRAESKDYKSWLKKMFPSWDLHHILGSNKTKLNDFLLCPMPHDVHMQIEAGRAVEGYSEEEQLLFAIQWLIKYTQELENNLGAN